MDNEIKEKVRPIYKRLQGYLSQAPTAKEGYYEYNSFCWAKLKECIMELENITKDSYTTFNVTVIPPQTGDSEKVERNEFRMQLSGLIMDLKGKYFQEEVDPFGGGPVVSVSQTQNVQVSILLEINTLIDRQLFGENAKNLKPEEKSFLEKVKSQLSSVQTAVQLIALIVKVAQECSLNIHTIGKMFGL